jgi:hypothetical protein
VEAVIEALGAARVPDLVGALITTGWLADTGMPEERAGLVELVESSGMEGLILSLELEEGTSLPRGWPNSSSLPTPGCLSPGSRGSATAGGHLTGSGARPGFAPCRGRGGPGGRSAGRGCAHAVGEGGHDGGVGHIGAFLASRRSRTRCRSCARGSGADPDLSLGCSERRLRERCARPRGWGELELPGQ